MVTAVGLDAQDEGVDLKPYYLLWGYRKCGTTSLANTMKTAGVNMPDWDESNIWLARPEMISGHLNSLWQGQWDDPYLVDLSTLTHLSLGDPEEYLAPMGFRPIYIVCTRPVGPRWLSAFSHMHRKRADGRSLRRYVDFYEGFIGLSLKDLWELEDDLISRDLSNGLKSHAGLIGPDYFSQAYPVAFEANPLDGHYQFRYFAETIDMLYKRPKDYIELSLADPTATGRWIAQEFGVDLPNGAGPNMNRNSLFNRLRYHPNIVRLSRHLPRPVRQRVSRLIETSHLVPRIGGGSPDVGVERAMSELIVEMLRPSVFESQEA